MKEECGAIVDAGSFRKVAIIEFEFVGDPVILEVRFNVFCRFNYFNAKVQTNIMHF